MMKQLPDIQQSEWRWPHFTRDELKCKGNGECCMSPDFLDLLSALRKQYDRPMVISSGYRSPDYNVKVSSTGEDGPHTQGRAVDVIVRGEDAYDLIHLAMSWGFTGIGVKQHGESRFVHIDNLKPEDGYVTRPWIWSYP